MKDPELINSPLGKTTEYTDQLNPKLLFAIPRINNRKTIDINENNLPFMGHDLWNGYEFSWLEQNQQPISKNLILQVDCYSPNLIESKSLKLYLYSYANTCFTSEDLVLQTLVEHLSTCAGKPVKVELSDRYVKKILPHISGNLLDDLAVDCNSYNITPEFLSLDSKTIVEETLVSDLLKSNCLVTGKPDWGSIRIYYQGPKISHAGLLKYIISFRNHQGFHEQCVEKIYVDLMARCSPIKLLVDARYTRRGSLDINPVRANFVLDNDDYYRIFRQ